MEGERCTPQRRTRTQMASWKTASRHCCLDFSHESDPRLLLSSFLTRVVDCDGTTGERGQGGCLTRSCKANQDVRSTKCCSQCANTPDDILFKLDFLKKQDPAHSIARTHLSSSTDRSQQDVSNDTTLSVTSTVVFRQNRVGKWSSPGVAVTLPCKQR